MPRIKVRVPAELLTAADARAEALGCNLSEVFAGALERYVEVTKNSSAGSVRSRSVIPPSSPEVVVDIPEALFQRSEKAAKRQRKQRHVLYADALAVHLKAAGTPDRSALDAGHDLPSGANRPPGPPAS
jgi:metal-responsive CopG/Arc/MetJ family transcriptional regulator